MPDVIPGAEPSPNTDGRGAVIGAAWAARAFAGLCMVAGLYAASVSLLRIHHGEPSGTWLLPLTTGVLTAVLGAVVACEREKAAIASSDVAWRAVAIALLGLYALALLPAVGFLAASIALVCAIAGFYTTRKFTVAIGGLAVVAGLWAFFAFVLAEPLPRGLWWR